MEASALTTAGRSRLLARRSRLLRLQGDEKLVALIRDGHDRAFEVLFERYRGRLLSFCRHMVGSSQDAEDLLQEVFVAAHLAIVGDERPINARPWLYRIARNRCLNHLRRPAADGQDSMDLHPHANGTTTLDRVQRREELRRIVADIHELPETQRSALVMRELDGLGYTEIAQAMGMTLAAVKSLLVRARISLAEASESRVMACDDVRLELAEAAEGLRRVSGPARRHVKECPSCRRFRGEIRQTSRSLASLAPVGLFAAIGKLFGIKLGGGSSAGGAAGSTGGAGGAAGGGTGAAGAGAAGSVGAAGSLGAAGSVGGAAAAAGGSGISLGGALGAAGGVVGAKAAVGVATAALITAGAVGVNEFRSPQPTPPQSATPAAKPSEDWSVEHSRARATSAAHAPAPPVTPPANDEGTAPPEPGPPADATPSTDVPPAPDPPADVPATDSSATDTGATDGADTTATGDVTTVTPDETTADGTTHDTTIVDGSATDSGTAPDPDPPPITNPPATVPPSDTTTTPPTDTTTGSSGTTTSSGTGGTAATG